MFANSTPEEHLRTVSRKDSGPLLLEDSKLWLSFRDGNDLAFSVLYKKYVPRLYNYGMHACHEHDLVMDCLQELFTRLWDKRRHLSAIEGVNFYLFKSFRRLLFGKLARKRRFHLPLLNPEGQGFEILSLEDVWIGEEISAEQSHHLNKAIQQLTRRQREVIFLRFFNELSCAEVAEVMELRIDSVYNLITKAIVSLRKTVKRSYMILLAVASLFT